MNLFPLVKAAVTTRQAAERYGLKVSRNGMTCCPFHQDKTPSMKVDGRKQDVLAEVRKFGTVDELLPPPNRLMTASTYREKVAIPLVKTLFAWCKQLVVQFRKAKEENRALRRQLDKVETASERLYDKAGKFDKLVEILGLDRVEKYLEEHALRQRRRDRQNEKRNWIDR